MDSMYTNRFTMTQSDNEIILKFDWIVPVYDDVEVKGAEIKESKMIFMSREAAVALRKMLEKYENDSSDN